MKCSLGNSVGCSSTNSRTTSRASFIGHDVCLDSLNGSRKAPSLTKDLITCFEKSQRDESIVRRLCAIHSRWMNCRVALNVSVPNIVVLTIAQNGSPHNHPSY